MLYYLNAFSDGGDIFNLFRYITFRAGGAFFTSLVIFFIFGNFVINFLSKLQKDGQPIRKDGPERHITDKAGTPTMGGVFILIVVLISTVCWSRWDNKYVWIILFVTFSFGLIGLIDDYLKVVHKNSTGFSSRIRLFLGFAIAFVATYFIQTEHSDTLANTIALPIFKDHLIPVGMVFFPFSMLVIVGSANAVNLTDGLDGLAIMPVIIAGGSLGIIAYIVGRADYSAYLDIHYINGGGEILIFTAALIGSGLGFLWYNAPPAAVFMGDTGALALGSSLGSIAVAIKHELVLFIIGGLFVIEALSVIIQVLFFKITGKRVFLMAPIHHHFEKLGWSESQIVIRFWIIAVILAALGMATLKLR
jgi:phospho-N-acetylmuramoyl-pentapeptide-transferase